MLDEALLDDPEALARADSRDLLHTLASAGARVRTSARLADEAGLADLKPDGRPRTVLLAADGQSAQHAGELLAALSAGSCPFIPVRPSGVGMAAGAHWALPGWAGPVDLLLLASPGPGIGGADRARSWEVSLVPLVEQAYQRGCSVVSVAPQDSPLAESTRQARGLNLPFAPPPVNAGRSRGASTGRPGRGSDFGGLAPGFPDPGFTHPDFADPGFASAPGFPGGGSGPAAGGPTGTEGGWGAGDLPADEDGDAGALWALLVPLLGLADRIGLANAPSTAVQSAADRLDEMAASCGPAIATYQNPAKTLAAELAESLPLLWSEGPGPDAVARRFAAVLAERAGQPALPTPLPDALTAHRGLLAGSFANGDDTDAFFRDRIEEPAAKRLRVVLLREHGPEGAASEATPAHQLALEHGTPVSEVRASGLGPVEDAAQLLALTDFASTYLALADRS